MTARPEPDRESPDPARGPTPADLRADYDDDFGRVRTPREIARRRLLIPAIDFIFLGIGGIVVSVAVAVFVVIDYIEDAADPLEYLEMVGLLAAIGVGGAVSVLIAVAGDGMLRLRRHRAALIAAYIVTVTSLASVFAILFYPFGIWALVLLHKTEVRREFDRPDQPGRPRPPAPRWAFLAVGGFGLVVLLVLLAVVAWDSQAGGNWDAKELLLTYVLLLIGVVVLAGVVVYGFVQSRRQGVVATRSEHPHVERPGPTVGAGPQAPADV